MFEIIQKLAPAPPTGLYSHVAPLKRLLLLRDFFLPTWKSFLYKTLPLFVAF